MKERMGDEFFERGASQMVLPYSIIHSLLKVRKSMSKPSAILVKLEDCPIQLDRMLVNACWDADNCNSALCFL